LAKLHFGITGGARPWLGELAGSLKALGYEGAWANDIPGHPGIPAAQGLAEAPGLTLGIGVVSLAEHPATAVAASVHGSGIAPSRLILGVGSGGSRSLALVRDGVAALRRELPDVRLAVAALGPRMCELGGEVADVVLLNWATPARIAWARERIAAGAARQERPMPAVAAYVRVAVGPDAVERLEKERRRYTRIESYARMFGAEGGAPGIARATGSVAGELRPYREALDICVVRGLPAADTLDGWLTVAEAAV
jgi:alkanesulfonate monooxygenase SsuD/methylene tetrahydromethanopterin reductase-like flavin-dependent oxidoreductase (luciferase family)